MQEDELSVDFTLRSLPLWEASLDGFAPAGLAEEVFSRDCDLPGIIITGRDGPGIL
ncbi:MAG: sensor histidine kinase, partial [Planctomycetes bacterium]|nr:sensor histidine kinase [Planctomycetota bacterium]